MDASQLKRLKEMEEENHRLKKMYADLSLDHHLLKEILEKKVLKPCERRDLAVCLVEEYNACIGRSCRVVNLPRSMWYYQSAKDDSEVEQKLEELAEKHPNRGFDDFYGRIRNQGYKWNRKRVLRIYRKMNLKMRRKRKRRLPSRIKEPLQTPDRLNRTWSMDFMHDVLESGRRIRVFNVMDDFNREALLVEAAYSHNSTSIIYALEELLIERPVPKRIRVDNGPEFIAGNFKKWCEANEITLTYIQPGKPAQNAYIERFNRLYREDVLDAYVFETLDQVRIVSNKWKEDYNENHPHSALGGKSPRCFAVNRAKLPTLRAKQEFISINSNEIKINKSKTLN